MNDEVKPSSSFASRLGRTLLRILLVLIVIAGIAAGVYYGTPYIYNRYILPVEVNTSRLDEFESKQAADTKQYDDQITDLKTRLADLETRQTDAAQTIAALQGQVDALETAVDTHTQTLKQLEIMQANLDTLNAASALHESMLVGKNSPLADLQRQVTLSRSIELLSRARLYLSQSNFGLAKGDVQAAQYLLVALKTEIPEEKAAALQSVITRVDLALGNLPAFPVVAVDDVDIAWQLLVNDLPEQPPVTPTPVPAPETPIPTLELTPLGTPIIN